MLGRRRAGSEGRLERRLVVEWASVDDREEEDGEKKIKIKKGKSGSRMSLRAVSGIYSGNAKFGTVYTFTRLQYTDPRFAVSVHPGSVELL
jgi:hypothetical protein